ncbi:hypothetical protein F4810DRAFT_649562 [Camillea tinctor]|nr:hypothetical protein F4810DRAFT_649562 [Camillea tinctor]
MASTTAVKTPVRTSNRPEDTTVVAQWKIYDTIMTPVNFITFIISLYLVDTRYQEQRARGHDAHPQQQQHRLSRILPVWLHALVFRPRPQLQPYEWVGSPSPTHPNTKNGSVTGDGKGSADSRRRPADGMRRSSRDQQRWYYHTQQKKLLKMEAADAFELRNAVLLGLAAAALVVGVLGCWVAREVWWLCVR